MQTRWTLPRIQDYSEDSIPVLDEENRMLGVVTAQSLIQTVDDALSEDYARLAGLSAEEDLNETLVQSVRKRLPWLLLLRGLGHAVWFLFQNCIFSRRKTSGSLTASLRELR